MSRRSRELRLEANERWPNLCQFLGGHLHQDWPIHSGSPEKAVEHALAEWDLAGRRSVLVEWRDWNQIRGCRPDVTTSMNDELGVDVFFETDLEARQFMNMVYDKLITSVRAETSKDWKP